MMKNNILQNLQAQQGGRGSSLLNAGLNFLLNFGIAVVWLGRWTIRWAARLWQRLSR